MVCTPQSPNCEECPMSSECRAFAESKLVSRGKSVLYDIEDSDGCHQYVLANGRDLRSLSAI